MALRAAVIDTKIARILIPTITRNNSFTIIQFPVVLRISLWTEHTVAKQPSHIRKFRHSQNGNVYAIYFGKRRYGTRYEGATVASSTEL
jgi:hypothetical protein